LVAVHDVFCKCKEIIPKKDQHFARHVQGKINGKSRIAVLLLDEINIPPLTDMREIEDYLLKKFIHDNKLAVLVTAGRSQPAMFNDFALRPNASNIIPLSVFDEEKTGRQMKGLKPGSEELAGKVVKLGNGVPGNTVKLTEQVAGDPPTINELEAIHTLLEDIKTSNRIEERYIPMLEALSILQGFFPEDVVLLFQCHLQLAGDRWDEGNVKEEFLNLQDIKVGPGGVVDWDREKKHWAMDESTRDLFERELQMRDPELWRKLHCTALGMYREWGEKYNSEKFQRNSIYHQQRLQSAGTDCSDLEG
jgi:hypothetical protein